MTFIIFMYEIHLPSFRISQQIFPIFLGNLISYFFKSSFLFHNNYNRNSKFLLNESEIGYKIKVSHGFKSASFNLHILSLVIHLGRDLSRKDAFLWNTSPSQMCIVSVKYDNYRFFALHSPIVEKNDLSPHSATKTKKKVLITVLAADNIPAPFPENFETANSAWFKGKADI